MEDKGGRGFLSSLIDTEALYHNAPCGYLSMLPDGTIISINRTLLSWLSYSSGEVVDRMNMTGLFSNGGKLYYQVFYLPLLQMQGKVNEVNFDVYRKDGSCFPALLNASMIKDEAGKAVAVNVVVTDITDRKKYETELLNAKLLAEAEKSKFETVAAHIPEMIWTANSNGRINYVNKLFADNFNILEISTEAARISELIHPEDRLNARRAWVAAIRRGNNFNLQVRLKNKQDQFHWYLFKGTPYRQGNGFPDKWLGSCLNIHDHVLELERRDEFISVASHELKTPVTSLGLSLQLLNSSKSNWTEQQERLVAQACRNAKKIQTLIRDLLNVKRLTEGQLSLRIQRVNVAELINNCVQAFLSQTNCEINISADHSLEIMADEHRIEQVLVNFINNAIKYAPGAPVSIIAEQINSKIKVTVADKGPGISGDKIPRLFERYYRADHSGKEYSGLGLGLYICAEIVQRHGGTIGVDSLPGEGSAFWFML